jgi:hypothetical protein
LSEKVLDEKLPISFKTHKIVAGTSPTILLEMINLLEKEKIEFFRKEKDKFAQQINVYMLYDYDQDHNNDLRIELKQKLENRKELWPSYGPPPLLDVGTSKERSIIDAQEQLKLSKGAIIFYGTTTTNWFNYWQSEIQKIYSLKKGAVCLSEPGKVTKIKRDVNNRVFLVMEDEQKLDQYITEFIQYLSA